MDSNKNIIKDLQSELKLELEKLEILKNSMHQTRKKIVDLETQGTIFWAWSFLCWIAFCIGVVLAGLSECDGYPEDSLLCDDSANWLNYLGYIIWIGSAIFFLLGLSTKIDGKKNTKLLYHQIKKERNELQNQKKKVEDIKVKLNTKRDNTLQSLIIELSSELDLNSDNTIDVIQHENEFYNLLKSNQSIILEMEKSENRDFTKQFVKLSNFLVEKEKNLQSIFKRISDIKEYENFEAFKSNLIDQIQFYNILRLNSLQMISSFIDDDRITFYMIYEKLDKLGVWNTNFENQFLIKMDLLNSNINRLISEIKDMSQSINSSISELIFITNENTDSVTKKLKEIGSKLDTSNLLNTINTYQNFKTNQRLK